MEIPNEKLFAIVGKLQVQSEILSETVLRLQSDLEEKNKKISELQKQLDNLEKDTEH